MTTHTYLAKSGVSFGYKCYPTVGSDPPTCPGGGKFVAAFRYRADAARCASIIRNQCGYAISSRLSRNWWYVRMHKTSCRCGNCPTLRADGTVRGEAEP